MQASALCEGQQGDVAGLLDGAGQAALVRGANAGQAARHNLAALGHKLLQQTHIAVGDRVDLLGAELADLLAAEELAASARPAGSTGTASGTTTGSGAGSTAGRSVWTLRCGVPQALLLGFLQPFCFLFTLFGFQAPSLGTEKQCRSAGERLRMGSERRRNPY